MVPLPEKRSSRVLFLLATMLVFIGYAWLGSKAFEPKLRLPSQLVSSAAYIEDGEAQSWSVAFERHGRVLTRLSNELKSLNTFFEVIGSLKSPVVLVITADDPLRYQVTETRVELGSDIAISDGQMAKALFKAWVLQRARPPVASSLLRSEVVSDVFVAIWSGDMEIGVPGEDQALVFPEAKAWPLALASFQRVCESPWKSFELNKTCGLLMARKTNTSSALGADEDSGPTLLGLRPYLGAMIWSAYQELPYLARMEFAREWALTLRYWDTDTLELDAESAPGDWSGWRDRVQSEFQGLLPAEKWKSIVKETCSAEEIVVAARAAHASAGLSEDSSPGVDFVFHSRASRRMDRQRLAKQIDSGNAGDWKSPVSAILSSEDGLFTAPGLARLTPAGLSSLHAKMLVWESCEAPTIKEVLEFPIVAQRILYVRSCGQPLESDYASLMESGVEGFAVSNPRAAFIQMQRAPAKLAFAKRILRGDITLSELMHKKPALRGAENGGNYLGLQNAEWRNDVRAFKVLGAIEAVEWFRMGDDSGDTVDSAPKEAGSEAFY